MPYRAAKIAAACLVAASLVGCASTRPPRSADLSLDEVLARLSRQAPRTLDGKGRLGIRTPEGDSSLSFRLAFDAGQGLRIDVTWTTLVGLVRRDGTLLVRGDSVWVLQPGAERNPSRDGFIPFGAALPSGLGPAEFVGLLVGRIGDLTGRREDLVAFRRQESRDVYTITLRSGERTESLTLDASTLDVIERTVGEPAAGRQVRATYEKHARVGGARRPFSIDMRDSEGPIRVRFLYGEQQIGRPQDARLFVPPPGARLVSRISTRQGHRPSLGTFAGERGSW